LGSGATTVEPLEVDDRFGAALYDREQTGGLPDEAVLASLGCGNPTSVAEEMDTAMRLTPVDTG